MIDPRERLRLARERVGKTPEEIASAVRMNFPSYYDLEWVDGEFELGISLGMLQKVCAELKIRTSDLFADEPIASNQMISLEGLVARIKEHLQKDNMTITEFEMKVGFRIGNCLEDPSSILEWGVECLQYVCEELGFDWRLALPEMDMRQSLLPSAPTS